MPERREVSPERADCDSPPAASDGENLKASSAEEYARFLTAYDEALAEGKTEVGPPSEIPAEFADDFEQPKQCLGLLEQCWPRQGNIEPRGTHILNFNRQAADATDATAEEGVWFGRFRILRYLGSGGGGVVLAAFDPVLDRKLALKIPHLEVVFLPDRQQRFLQEARTAASLNHPHINPVYDVGQVGPISYITSALCEGPTLDEWLRDREEPVDPKEAARLIACLASAVEHAHERGVWHRDLKPSNVLLDPVSSGDSRAARGGSISSVWMNFIPKLTDFGLAKVTHADASSTHSGVILGTPVYMAPEQASGQLREVGPWSDIYSLGVVLYELLVREPPFQNDRQRSTPGRSRSVVVEPRMVRIPKSDVPRDLEAICLRCLNFDPGLRYATARELVDDLTRFLAGEPTLARPIGWGSRAAYWISRRRALLAMSGLTGLFVMTGSAGYLSHRRRVGQAERLAADYQRSSRQAGDLVRRTQYAETVRGAHRAWLNTDLATARELLDRCRPSEGENDLRGFEWRYVKRLCDGGIQRFRLPTGEARAVAFSGDESHVLAANEFGAVCVWNRQTEKLVDQFQIHTSVVRSIAASPIDPWLIATTSEDGFVRLWRWNVDAQHEILHEFASVNADCVAFSPDGLTLAAGREDHTIAGWDVATGESRFRFVAHDRPVRCVAFSPDSRHLASVSEEDTARIWNVDSPVASVRTVTCPGKKMFAVAFSPDGRTLATGGDFNYLWSLVEQRERIMVPGHNNQVLSLAFSPDGRYLASAGFDMTVRVADVESQECQAIYRGHTRMIFDMKYSPMTRKLITAGRDGIINVWDGNSPQDRTPIVWGKAAALTLVALSRDGSRLASAVRDEAESRIELRRIDSKTPFMTRRIDHAAGAIAFAHAGQALLICCGDGPVLLWDIQTDELTALDDSVGSGYHCVNSPDGRFAAVSTNDEAPLRVLDLMGRDEVLRLPGHRGIGFSPDGSLLAMEVVAGDRFCVGIWSMVERRFTARFAWHNCPINCVTFSPDGKSLATGSFDGAARLWDPRTGTELLSIRAQVGEMGSLTFTPDGTSLVTGGNDGTVNFWDVVSGQQRLSLSGLAGATKMLAFTPDGRILITGQSYPETASPVIVRWDAVETIHSE